MAGLPLDPTAVTVFFLVFARLGAAVALLPGYGDGGVPVRIRLLFALALTAVLTPLVAATYGVPVGDGAVVRLVLGEVTVGLLCGFAVRLLWSSLQIAGGMIALHTGLAAASLFDPRLGAQDTVFGSFLATAGIAALFASGGDRYVLALLVESWRLLPPGEFDPAAALTLLDRLAAVAWRTALALAAPIVAVALATQLAMGLLGRLVPGIQILFVALPLQLLASLAILALTLGVGLGAFLRRFQEALDLFVS